MTATQQILNEIKSLNNRLSPVEGLLNVLAEPAKRAGLTPEQFLAKMTAGGSAAAVVGGDGAFAMTYDGRKREKFPHIGGGFGDMLEAMVDVQKNGANARADSHRRLFDPVEKGGLGVQKAALAEGSATTGGYLVPPQFGDKLLSLEVEEAVVRPRATVFPMTATTLDIPALDHTTAQGAGNTPFLAGVQMSWTAEAAMRAETEPTFRMVTLKAHEASFYTVASNNLLADSAIALDSLLTQLFGFAVPWYTDYAYLRGDGVGKPMGILNAACTISVNRSSGGTFKFADAASMMAKLYWKIARGAKVAWVINQSVIPQLLQMADAGNRVIFIPLSAGLQAALPQSSGVMSIGTIFGIPVLVSEKLPALGTKGDVMLCDFSQYLLGDRQEITIDVSPHVNFLKNQMVWRVVWRGDGQPWLNNTITIADNATTVSPFVVLN